MEKIEKIIALDTMTNEELIHVQDTLAEPSNGIWWEQAEEEALKTDKRE